MDYNYVPYRVMWHSEHITQDLVRGVFVILKTVLLMPQSQLFLDEALAGRHRCALESQANRRGLHLSSQQRREWCISESPSEPNMAMSEPFFIESGGVPGRGRNGHLY